MANVPPVIPLKVETTPLSPPAEVSIWKNVLDAYHYLLDFSLTHSREELLTATLDEAEKLTGSLIGFFHFVESDQEHLTLQAWSSATTRQFCETDVTHVHYPVSQAGIWVDCIRERRPVIHNDYEKEPHRRGLPKGHAAIIRELVVPVVRGELIVGVLGVGNSPSEYTDQDVEIISRLANLAWSLVERKVAEERLAESEGRYRTLFEDAGDYIFVLQVDPEQGAVIIDANNAACEKHGYPREEIIGMAVADLESPAYRHKIADQARASLVPGGKGIFETEHVRKDGRAFAVEASIRLLPQSAPPVVLSIERDITERKRAGQALSLSEQKYRRLVETLPDIIYSYSIRHGGIYYSAGVERTFGHTADQMLANPTLWQDAIHRDDRTTVTEAITRFLAGEDFDITYRVADREGAWHWLRDRCYGRRDSDGDVIIDGIASDITAEKRAAEALRISEERFSQVADTAEEFIWEVDRDGTYLFANGMVEKILGYTPDELVGKMRFFDLFPPDMRGEQKEKAFTLLARMEPFHCFRNQNIRKDGKVVIVETSGAPMFDASGDVVGYRGADTDITARVHLEEQLRQSQKMEAVGELAGGVAHDFNNLLQVITTYGYLIQMQCKEHDLPSQFVEELLQASRRAAELTGSLLAFSRKRVMNPKLTHLDAIVNDARKLLHRVIGENIECIVRQESAGLTIMADEGQMQQMLLNLATNARDAMPRGGQLTIATGRVELDDMAIAGYGCDHPGEFALVTVTDTGSGMDEETTRHIFEPFFTTKETGKGTGLGLSIVYGIVKQHGGFIAVESHPGCGTTFSIHLPLVPEEAVIAAVEKPQPLPRGTETVLLVEDDQAVRFAFAAMLRAQGYTILEAANGEVAVDVFRQHRDAVDLVVMDIVMPRKNGCEAWQEIQQLKSQMKVLFVSGYTMDIINNQGALDGAELLMKPVPQREFLEKVRCMLDGTISPTGPLVPKSR